MELLTNFKQTNATHISDQFHEWRRHCLMVKTFFPDQLLAKWFIKSLLLGMCYIISMTSHVWGGKRGGAAPNFSFGP